MPIITPIIRTENGVTFHELTAEEEFYAVGHDENNLIVLFTKSDSPIGAGETVRSMLAGFGATTYAELLTEIANRNLIFPEP